MDGICNRSLFFFSRKRLLPARLLQSPLNRRSDIGHNGFGLILRFPRPGSGAGFVDAGLDEDRVPGGSRRAVELVGAGDVGGRVIAYHVHFVQFRLRGIIPLVLSFGSQQSLAMCLQFPFGEGEGRECWLAEELILEFHLFRPLLPDHGVEHRGQRLPEASLPESVQVILRRPQQVRVREVHFRLPVLLPAVVRQFRIAVQGRDGAEDASLGEEQVDHYLYVQGPVPRVVEYEDCGDAKRVAEFVRDGTRVGGVEGVVGDGPEGRVGGYEVCGREHLGEAVAFAMVSGFSSSLLLFEGVRDM